MGSNGADALMGVGIIADALTVSASPPSSSNRTRLNTVSANDSFSHDPDALRSIAADLLRMAAGQTAEYQVSELERALSQRKKEKLNADHNAYLKITEKDEISKALVYVDRFPLLAFRKRVVSYWERVRGICFKVVKHPKFEWKKTDFCITPTGFGDYDDPGNGESAGP